MNGPSSGDWVLIVGIICLAIMAVEMVRSIPAKMQVTAEAKPAPVAVSCACDDCRCCDACPGNRGGERE